MFECPNCKNKSLIWQSDSNAEDYGIKADGVISSFHCTDNECDVYSYLINLYVEGTDIEYSDTLIERWIEDDEENEEECLIAWNKLYERINNNFFSKIKGCIN